MDLMAWKVIGVILAAALVLWVVARWPALSGVRPLAVPVVLVGAALGLASIDVPASGTCSDVEERSKAVAAAAAAAAGDVPVPVALELAPDGDTTVDFRLRRDVRRPSVFLQQARSSEDDSTAASQGTGTQVPSVPATVASIPKPGTGLQVLAVDFEREGGDYQLDPRHVWAEAVVRSNGGGVRLTLCVKPQGAPAGKYAGSVVFDDTRVSAGAVPWTISLQYEKWWLAAFAGLLVALAAFFYSYSTTGNTQGLGEYAKQNFIGIAAGLATATVAFIGAYWTSTDWGGDPDDWLKGAGVVFAAFTTGFLAQRMRPPAG